MSLPQFQGGGIVWPSAATILIVAHPDDETIGAGAQLLRLRQPLIVVVTDGSPRDLGDAAALGFGSRAEYAVARDEEMRRALALTGIWPDQVRRLGFIDQEASLAMAVLVERIVSLLKKEKPPLIVTHAYEGGHPDHDATAFAVHMACGRIDRQTGTAPRIVEMTSYHAGPVGMSTGEFLPWPGSEVHSVRLSAQEQALKLRLFGCYASQRQVLANFSLASEQFREAPAYDFRQPPHEGPLFYESFPWGMTGAAGRELARQIAQ